MKRIGREIPVVEVEAGRYLLDILFRVGPGWASGMGGETPLPWSELLAYAQATGAISEPWEFEALSAMSRAYVAARADGGSVLSIAPADLPHVAAEDRAA